MASHPPAKHEQVMPQDWYGAATGQYGQLGFGSTLRHLLMLVRRNLWLIVGVILAALGLALVLTMLQTPQYRADTAIQINDQTDQILGTDMEALSTEGMYWDADRFLNTQLGILRSRGLAERVDQRLSLSTSDRFYNAMQAGEPAAALSQLARRNMVTALLQSNLDVELPRESRIVQLRFSSTDPELSAQIANAFADEFIQSNLQRRFDSSAYARKFVEEQLEEARVRLESSERELNTYARQAGLIRTRATNRAGIDTEQGSVTASSLMQLNEAANSARASRVLAEARWNSEQQSAPLASSAVLANPTVQTLMTRRAELEGQLEAAQSRYLGDHPTVQQLSAELASTRGQLNATASQVRNSIRAEFIASQRAENRLQSEVGQMESKTLAEQDRSVRYNTLARQADTDRSLYDGLLQRYRELNAAAGIAASNISIIDRADTPLGQSSPNLFKNLLLGLIAGLGLAGVVVFLRDQLDDVIRTPEDIEEKIALPLLGVVPRAQDGDVEAALADPKTPVAEAYNSLRGSLLYATRQGLPKIMLVTSAQPTEGKSTSSLAIASGLARMGRRTILVDADLRRPAMHNRFGLKNDRGLSSLLVSSDPIASAAFETGEDGLYVIPSGPLPPSPTELLTSPRMAGLLDELGASYDAVVVDSPPVLGLADAPVLAALADGVVFIVEADRGRGGALKAALRRLRSMNPVLLGAVLTKFDPSKQSNRYSNYYGYDYYRYENSGADKG